ncbi:hypothetical protein [Neotamlana laminarinivorans]|uniref:Uncharacterized protein n=1 Tax=Neotamlana laminarinivorans TaxID=2883124 RepID=A0A9X1L5B7_9FLAO|nr:hypothetical protein [Tamlana laminarinivorans]MCB4800309.1 hypothetical protein [Tamlana laminarinivorans]
MKKINITTAGNIEAPSYQILKENGYRISKTENYFIVEKENVRLSGESFLEILGLSSLVDLKGENWKVDESVIDEMLSL